MKNRYRSLAIVAVVFIADRLTKLYIREHVTQFDVFPMIPRFFNIVHTENPGAAFGFLGDIGAEWRRILLVLVSAIVLTIIAPLLARAKGTALAQTGLALIFGGALGNLWDRIGRGTVTDFLQLFFGSYEFPSFNVADSAITIGAVLLLIDMWRTERQHSTG